MKKIAERLDTRKRRISLTPIICAALLAWLTVAPGYNPGVPTATAHTHMSGGDPSIGSASYYRTNDYILDARSINAMGIGDDPGTGSGSGSTTGVAASAHGYVEARLLRQLFRGRDMHSNEQVVYDVDGYSLAYAQAGTHNDIDNPDLSGAPKSGQIGIYRKWRNLGHPWGLVSYWVREKSFGITVGVAVSDPHGKKRKMHYAFCFHRLKADSKPVPFDNRRSDTAQRWRTR